MIFSSNVFVFCFLPVVAVIYYVCSKADNPIYQRLFLIAASLLFYGYSDIRYLLVIGASILSNYFIGLGIQNLNGSDHKRLLLGAGVFFNIGLLGYFKYYNFFLSNMNWMFEENFKFRNIILPLGISFFTFKQLYFLISIYRNEEQVAHISEYCFFVTFFPQLVSGPVILYNEMLPQIRDHKRRFFNSGNFSKGIYLFVSGLFKKTVIADTISVFADNGFGMDEIGFAAALITSLSYTLQIYFDFSGYSDMAVGLGKMFNIDLPYNFMLPYKAESISDFWRRWHITLGRILYKCVYLPLGGNKKGICRTCVNLMITFLVSGIWHGADWTFVLWGCCHGILVVAERLLGKRTEVIPSKIRMVITFLTVNFLWVLFRAESLGNALLLYKGMLGISGVKFEQISLLAEDGLINFPVFVDIIYVIGIIIILLTIVFKSRSSSKDIADNFVGTRKNAVFTAMLFCLAVICMSREAVFIYYSF